MEDQKTNWRVRLHLILEEPTTSRAATAFGIFSAFAILVQVVVIMLESGSFGALGDTCEGEDANCSLNEYDAADITLSVLFTVELVLRSICVQNFKKQCLMSVFWWADLLQPQTPTLEPPSP